MENAIRLTNKACIELLATVEENISHYTEGNFEDVLRKPGYTASLPGYTIDINVLSDLVPSTGAEVESKNSLLVFNSLPGMAPRMARDEGVWTYLTHGPCLNFSRERWIVGQNQAKLPGRIRSHFFANTLTRCRDDNAISRLWWNGYVASIASPGDIKSGLDMILATADIRSNFVERPQITSWPTVCQGIVRHMKNESWIVEKEANFRAFMIAVNFRCGGILLEGLNDSQIDVLMSECSRRAKNKIKSQHKPSVGQRIKRAVSRASTQSNN